MKNQPLSMTFQEFAGKVAEVTGDEPGLALDRQPEAAPNVIPSGNNL